MESVFYHLFNFSINAGWLVIAVLILRLLLKKAPRWLVCSLWALVGVRLIFPFSIESVFSLIPSAQTVPPDIVYESEPAIDSGITAVNSVVNPIIGEYFAPKPMTSINPLQALGYLASFVWLIGLCLMVGYMLFGYLRLRYRLGTATKREHGVFESENVSSPFILGVFRPRIYLPYGLDDETFFHVISHERAHLARRDHLIKPFAFLLLSVYWFQPLLWVAYVLLCRDIEYACDEKVIKNKDEGYRREYSMALLSCSIHRRLVAACPLAFGEVGVKGRVKNVMNYKKPAFWIILLAVIAMIVTAVCFLTNPKTENAKANVSPPMYYAAERIKASQGVNYFSPEHIPYFYIDENMTLYEKRKVEMTGCFVEEWKLCGTLEKIEGAREGSWRLFCEDEFGNMSMKQFMFEEDGDVSYIYADGNGGTMICKMVATDQMPGQLNVLSLTQFRADIGVSHYGTEISCEETREDLYGDIRLDINIKNNTEYILVHYGCEVYVDEKGVNRVRSTDDICLEKETANGWQTIDYRSPFGWRSYGGNTARFFFEDEKLEKGLYRLTFFVDLATKTSNFESEETVEYVEKNVPCAEIIFEIVNPGETINKAAEIS